MLETDLLLLKTNLFNVKIDRDHFGGFFFFKFFSYRQIIHMHPDSVNVIIIHFFGI